MSIDAVEIKTGEGVTLRNGDSVTFTETLTIDDATVVERKQGPAYVERDGVLEVYPDWQRPFVDVE